MKKGTTAALIVSGLVGGGVAGASPPDVLSDPAEADELVIGEADAVDDLLLDGIAAEAEPTGTVLAQTIYGGDPDDSLRRRGSGTQGRDRLQGGRTFDTIYGGGGNAIGGSGGVIFDGGGVRRPRQGGLIDGSTACCTIEAN